MKITPVTPGDPSTFEKNVRRLADKKAFLGRNFLVIKDNDFHRVGLLTYVMHCFKQAFQGEEELKQAISTFLKEGITSLNPNQANLNSAYQKVFKGTIQQLAARGHLDKDKVDGFLAQIDRKFEEKMKAAEAEAQEKIEVAEAEAKKIREELQKELTQLKEKADKLTLFLTRKALQNKDPSFHPLIQNLVKLGEDCEELKKNPPLDHSLFQERLEGIRERYTNCLDAAKKVDPSIE